MADSTSNLDLIAQSQASKEVTANAAFDAASPAMLFGRRQSTTSGLNWGYYGGRIYIDGAATAIANSTLSLTASQTNYVEVSNAGVVSANTAGFSADKAPLYKVVTGASTITSYEDHRNANTLRRLFYGRSTVAMDDANKTLTHAQAACDSLEFTGALTALRDVIVPTVRRPYTVYANTSGGFGIRVKTAAGTGITVTDGNRITLECDGTNVVRVGNAAGLIAGGTAGQVLSKIDGTDYSVQWVTPTSGFANPMTTAGDLIAGGTAGAAQRLAAGTNGQVLTMVSGAPAWAAASGFTGGALTSDLIGSDQVWSRGMLKDMGNVYADKGNSGTTTQTLDYTAGSHQKITATGNHTIATSNWPPSGNLGELLLELVNGGAYTITWPTVNWIKSDGSTTTTFSSNGVTLQSSGTDWVYLWSRDGGTTIYGKIVR